MFGKIILGVKDIEFHLIRKAIVVDILVNKCKC